MKSAFWARQPIACIIEKALSVTFCVAVKQNLEDSEISQGSEYFCKDTYHLNADTPARHADGYHSCYALTGLSSAQHRSRFAPVSDQAMGPLECAFGWSHIKDPQDDNESDIKQICDPEDIVEPIHPIFVIPYAAVEHTRSFFSSKLGF